MNIYQAKFERESKSDPTSWVIAPSSRGFKLVYIGGRFATWENDMLTVPTLDCIHPHCLCLDYCEAEDPYSKTPTVDWMERKLLAEAKERRDYHAHSERQ